jgi:hypothetical protein
VIVAAPAPFQRTHWQDGQRPLLVHEDSYLAAKFARYRSHSTEALAALVEVPLSPAVHLLPIAHSPRWVTQWLPSRQEREARASHDNQQAVHDRLLDCAVG